jgi:hypothetical protein
MRQVDVVLRFDATVTESQRDEFLARLDAVMSPDMRLTKSIFTPVVHFEHADPTAAVVSVQQRAKPICEALGLPGHVTWAEGFIDFSRDDAQQWLDERLGRRMLVHFPLSSWGNVHIEGKLEEWSAQRMSPDAGPFYTIGGALLEVVAAEESEGVRFRFSMSNDQLIINDWDLEDDVSGDIAILISEKPGIPQCSKCGEWHEIYESCPQQRRSRLRLRR